MAVLSFNSNLFSQGAQRRLSESTSRVSKTYERLSSGLRINAASDDAAGLAISSQLSSDVRVYTQGIRNVNDGISALNIADGTTGQLMNVLTRLKELATQAANGTYSLPQRTALDAEGQALTNEFNRIVGSTKFNGRQLLDGSLSNFSIQAGYGTDGVLNAALGQALIRTVGTGAMQSSPTGSITDASAAWAATADFNGDGKDDVVLGESSNNPGFNVRLSNGDGTFTTTFSVGAIGGANATMTQIQVGDFNNDGKKDFAVSLRDTTALTGSINVYLGNGDGTFQTGVSYGNTAGSTIFGSFDVGDINGDGNLDFVVGQLKATGADSNIKVLLGRGDGTFSTSATLSFDSFNYNKIALGDFNGDGNLDALASAGANGVRLLLGNGAGSFSLYSSTSIGAYTKIAVGDFNHDGKLDLAGGKAATNLDILLGNGNGTFQTAVSYNVGANSADVTVTDINGDGIPDLVQNTISTYFNVLIGRGDGTFNTALTYTSGTAVNNSDIRAGDFNGDGAVDLVRAANTTGRFEIWFPNTQNVTTIPSLFLTTRQNALSSLSIIDAAITRVSREQSAIGVSQSRLSSTLRTLASSRENFAAAKSRITDADVAQEAGNLVRSRILQQAGAAVLAQANIQPQIALNLLKH